jgi:hypothetical protein
MMLQVTPFANLLVGEALVLAQGDESEGRKDEAGEDDGQREQHECPSRRRQRAIR